MEKIYVGVIAEHDMLGNIKPIAIKLENGRTINIDKVTDIRVAASLKCGGQGMRYTLKIAGRSAYLFDDDGRWFIEKF